MGQSYIVETLEQEVVALPTASTRFEGVTRYGQIAFEVELTEGRRSYRVTMDGQDFEFSLPASAASRHFAFDPRRRAFTKLLPSLRIELTEHTDLTPLVEALQATGVNAFESLGFAFIDLPEDLHPVDALAVVSDLEMGYSATVRLPMPQIYLQ